MITILLVISIFSYTLAVVFTGQRFANTGRWGRRRIVLSASMAIITHVLTIGWLLNITSFNRFNIASTLLIIAALLSIFNLVRGFRPEAALMRPVIFTFAIVSLIFVAVTPVDAGQPLTLQHGVTIHVALSLLAFSILTLAALYSVELLYVNHLLKNHKAKALSEHLPPLLTVETFYFRLLTIGTAILTLAIASGFLFLDNMFAHGQLHKTILSISAWLTFNCILVIHYWRGLRGKPAVIFTLIACFLLVLAYYGSRIVRDVILT